MSTAPLGTGSVVLITGASSGIGEQLALQLASRGARLALAARGTDDLERVAEACRGRGGEALAVPTDVGVEAECRAFVDAAVKRWGRVDALVNNAGVSMWARFDEIEDLGLFERIMRVNYLGSVWCTHAALGHLEASRGRLVAVSSLTGLTGVPTRTAYAASKHAMRGFFDSLRIELRGTGVSVTVAYPGFVDTWVRRRATGPDGQPLGQSPVQEDRVMSPETCARLILEAADGRKRQVVMTARGRAGRWLSLVAPGLVDRLAARAIEQGR
ncbi:SDR family oxidoreductase [Rubrivirga sp. S365]|uniref:SDR family oxidoreductase n=1 Tax=Rubrivirga sp. S365 TaxID=3076080 RepID=UPI0028C7DFA9|nr:SDR family oxidoreductase [Rubrivirga sp. S365]MDT7855633.1 SDR family oxidoreductase [Rubrivirga sp. S365]